jgi:hypothetical protein
VVPIGEFLPDLAIFIAVFTIFVLGSVRLKPRIWLHDFPADIQALAAPKTEEEKRLTRMVGIPLVIIAFVLPIVLGWNLKAVLGANYSFLGAWIYAYGLWFGFNLWDLIVLDWLGFTLIDPQHPPFPGTEGAAGWRDYAFHFHGFLKGSMMGLAFATFVAGVITVLT